jgi:hypothetical protein
MRWAAEPGGVGPGEAFYERQRDAVEAKLARGRTRPWWFAVPAIGTAAACLLMVVGSPGPAPPPTPAPTDERLFAEIYESVHSDVPRAARPIRALFDGAPGRW